MRQSGFTLVEMIVVVSVIAIFTTVGLATFRDAGKQARDADRQADLRLLQSAVEQYKQKNGRYPARCVTTSGSSWSGQVSTVYACADGSSQYIVGLAPEFISALPQEKFFKGTDSGYVYTTNADGTVYKIEAKKTVESETVTYNHIMKSCDIGYVDRFGMCDNVTSIGGTPSWCQETDPTFQKSYAVWGGYANVVGSDIVLERQTENIICAIR